MIFLALKGVDAKVTTIDLVRKPTFFKENYSGMKLPCLIHEMSNIGKKFVLDDVNEIEDHIEEHFPDEQLKFKRGEDDGGTSRAEGKIFQKFSAWMRNKDKNTEDKHMAGLLDELNRLDKFLGSPNKKPGRFLAGDKMMQPDCVLLPKLHQLRVALGFYKGFKIPVDLENLQEYLSNADEDEIFSGTKCDDDEILDGWSKHVGDTKKAQQFLRARSGSISKN